MSWYPDLGNETDVISGAHVRAIGWLTSAQPFPTGPTSVEFQDALDAQVRNRAESKKALEFGWLAGGQDCEFCGKCYCSGNLGIPSGAVLYVAPEMIGHYVNAHSYAPPGEFIEAVMRCPGP